MLPDEITDKWRQEVKALNFKLLAKEFGINNVRSYIQGGTGVGGWSNFQNIYYDIEYGGKKWTINLSPTAAVFELWMQNAIPNMTYQHRSKSFTAIPANLKKKMDKILQQNEYSKHIKYPR